MPGLRSLLVLSLLATAGVLAWAALARARIDSRAHLASAEGLRQHAVAREDPASLVGAGEAYVRAIAGYTPFDPTPARAVSGLLATAGELGARGDPAAAARLLDAGLRAIDRSSLITSPLAAERVELERARSRLAPAGATASRWYDGAAPAADAAGTAGAGPESTP